MPGNAWQCVGCVGVHSQTYPYLYLESGLGGGSTSLCLLVPLTGFVACSHTCFAQSSKSLSLGTGELCSTAVTLSWVGLVRFSWTSDLLVVEMVGSKLPSCSSESPPGCRCSGLVVALFTPLCRLT